MPTSLQAECGRAEGRPGKSANRSRSTLNNELIFLLGLTLDGPLRAFFLRIRSCRGQHVAAVATARKVAVLVWHVLTKEQDYLWVRSALHATKLRRLELTAGHAPVRGQRGSAYDYNIKATRDQERRRVQQAEKIYERFVAGWNRRGPRVRTSAAKEERQ
jgi:transposase